LQTVGKILRRGRDIFRLILNVIAEMKNKRLLIFVIVLIAGSGGYIAYQWFSKPDQAPRAQARDQAVPVSSITVSPTSFPVLLTGLGTVQAFNTVTVRTRVDGEVTKIAFKEGDLVKPGDLLAQIDSRPYRAALDQAIAKKAQDEVTLNNAKLDLQRYSTLAKEEFASRQQLDTQVATVGQTTAQVQADQAALENAQTQLDYSDIKAPIGGRVGFRLVDQGNIVNASSQTGIVSITQVQPISVLFTLPEAQINPIRDAQVHGPVAVTAYTADGRRKLADGSLAVINNEVDTTTGVIQLKATFENADNALWPGQSVSAKLLLDTLQNVVVVPQSAVQHGPQGLSAYVVDANQRAHAQPIEVGESNDDSAVVTKGLAAGDRVVTAGQYRLQNGVLVTTVGNDPEAQASAQGGTRR